jgi:hypothetical protein
MTQRAHKQKARPRTPAIPATLMPDLHPAQTLPAHAPLTPLSDLLPMQTTQETTSFIAGPGATTFQEPIPLSQLLANAIANPAPAWPISGLLPAGLTLLASKQHAGSRTLVLQLALAIARGTSALDHFPATPGDVLYLNFHETQDTLLARTQHLLAGATLPPTLTCTNTWDDWQQDGLTNLDDWLIAHPTTRLLVIDSLSRILPPGTPIRHAYTLLRQLNHLAHTHHLCILLLHSLPRHCARDPFDAIPCSHLLLDTFETLAVLEHDRVAAQATLHLTGHTLQTHALTLSLEPETQYWSLDPTSIHTNLTPERLAILHALQRSDHGLKPAEIATTLKKEAGTIRRLLFTMVRAGLVIAQADGRYTSLQPILATPLSFSEPLAPSLPPSSQDHIAEHDHSPIIATTETFESSVTPTPSAVSPGVATPVTTYKNATGNDLPSSLSLTILHADMRQEPSSHEHSERYPSPHTTKETSLV